MCLQGSLGATKVIEVLCKTQAYVIKKLVDGTARPSGSQVTWKKHGGPMLAWEETLRRAGVFQCRAGVSNA